MDRLTVLELLAAVRDGRTEVTVAVEQLAVAPVGALGYAAVDVHRALRTGVAEVVYGAGKTAEQITGILQELLSRGQDGVVTRISEEKAASVTTALGRPVEWSPEGRVLVVRAGPAPEPYGRILIVSAGTSDLPVTEEVAAVARALGNGVVRVDDVGVAGLHRILGQLELLRSARVIVVVAGMDGALPGVVAGLVRTPVIAVPTSVGYGASFGGLAALLTMLNACAPGVSVVNIDNGFGAAYQASLINQLGRVP